MSGKFDGDHQPMGCRVKVTAEMGVKDEIEIEKYMRD